MSWILGGTLGDVNLEDTACASVCLPFGGPGVTVGVSWTGSDGLRY